LEGFFSSEFWELLTKYEIKIKKLKTWTHHWSNWSPAAVPTTRKTPTYSGSYLQRDFEHIILQKANFVFQPFSLPQWLMLTHCCLIFCYILCTYRRIYTASVREVEFSKFLNWKLFPCWIMFVWNIYVQYLETLHYAIIFHRT
jgi:hypothetical protein